MAVERGQRTFQQCGQFRLADERVGATPLFWQAVANVDPQFAICRLLAGHLVVGHRHARNDAALVAELAADPPDHLVGRFLVHAGLVLSGENLGELVQRLPGDQHPHDDGLARARRHLDCDAEDLGIGILVELLEIVLDPGVAAPAGDFGDVDRGLSRLDLAEEELAVALRVPASPKR